MPYADGRLGELVDLFTQCGDVLARFSKRVGQLLVLGHGLGQLSLGLEQSLLERADALGRFLQATPQGDDLFLEPLGLLAELGHLGVVGGQSPFVLGFVDGIHLLGLGGSLVRTLHLTFPKPAERAGLDLRRDLPT